MKNNDAIDEDDEAIKMAMIARRAERKAEQRAAERAAASSSGAGRGSVSSDNFDGLARLDGGRSMLSSTTTKPKFMTKAERQAAALARLEQKRLHQQRDSGLKEGSVESVSGKRQRDEGVAGTSRRAQENSRISTHNQRGGPTSLTPAYQQTDGDQAKELQDIREQYLGKKNKKKKVAKPSEKFAKVFNFNWENSDDTASHDANPIYDRRMDINPLLGRGYIAGIDMQDQRKRNQFNKALVDKRQAEERFFEQRDTSLSESDRREREQARREARDNLHVVEKARSSRLEASSIGLKGKHWREKSLAEMNERDWRIFREDFDIQVRGGRAPVPLRNWDETKVIPGPIIRAIEDLKYAEPSPIQRQAIPIGFEFRDVIGIAETGSGKTCAFVVPLLAYIMSRPAAQRESVAEDGPLGMIMAPTRQLAQQIEVECQRLSVHLGYRTVSIVGGQSIEDQGFRLREGVEVIIGTPGRLKDCLETRYLVLNQCNYIVLDEADRMVDMGFEVELNFVLESMGGKLKAENEDEAYQEEALAQRGEANVRVTAMFSATMPPEVEKLARTFLRHPAIVKIGDHNSGKNKRIEQVVDVCKDSQKPNRLVALASPKSPDDKIIVFVNEKKRCDFVANILDRAHIRCAVLHGGKSQDQREASLAAFRNSEIQALVATDVAGRGIDIPDVTTVVNFDMSKKIENYCHRIGRTGRAGKSGVAITLLSLEEDAGVLPDLVSYLESTSAAIPHALKAKVREINREESRGDL